jgi:hypothetical protein
VNQNKWQESKNIHPCIYAITPFTTVLSASLYNIEDKELVTLEMEVK